MTPELEGKLITKYPKLFRQAHLSERESCMGRGVETGDGWFHILDQLCERLTALGGVELAQVKEKFGLLRVYVDGYSAASEDLLAWAERASGTTCEQCGRPGKLNRRGWQRVRCQECRK